jgi:hypothetical protein
VVVFTLCAAAVIVTCSTAFGGSPLSGSFANAGTVAHGLGERLGAPAGTVFALLLLNGSILGAACVTLSTSYALGDVFGVKHSLHRGWRDARQFHGSFVATTAVAAALVLVPGAPLGLVTTAVQALAGVLLPGATVFLLLLCNDRAVLGPWTNPRWLNAVATLVVGALLVLSAVLTVTTLVPEVSVAKLAAVLVLGLALVLSVLFLASWRRSTGERLEGTGSERLRWTMPPLHQLARPTSSRVRTLALVVLRTYVLVAGSLLIMKVVEFALSG